MFNKKKNKNKTKSSEYTVKPLDFTHLGRTSTDGHLIVNLDDFEYIGGTADIKKGIPNIDKIVRMLGGLIVIDLKEKSYMAIKVKEVNTGMEFKVLNSMTELINFKKFVNQNVAISVSMEALRGKVKEQLEEEEECKE